MKKFILLTLAISAALTLDAQTMREDIVANPNLAGGIYTAYMVTESVVPEAPKGYKPFYISHMEDMAHATRQLRKSTTSHWNSSSRLRRTANLQSSVRMH